MYQVREKMDSTLEHIQVPNGKEPNIQRIKRPLFDSHPVANVRLKLSGIWQEECVVRLLLPVTWSQIKSILMEYLY